MADITLTSIAPGAPVQSVQPGNAAGTATGTPAAPPTLPAGTLISGFVLNRDAQGNPILRTTQGDFLLQSNFFFKIGSDVVARINTTGSNLSASILSVDGHSPQEAENITAHGTQASVIINNEPDTAPATSTGSAVAETAAPADTTAVVRASANLTGTLVQPATPEENAAAAASAPAHTEPPAAPLAAGTRLTFQLVDIALPPAAAPVEETAAPAAGSLTANPPAPPAAANTPSAAQAPSTPQTAAPATAYTAYARYAAPAPDTTAPTTTSASASAADAQSPSLMQAEVTGGPPSPAGANTPTMVQTPLGTVQLDNAPPLPTGSRLTLQLVQTAAPAETSLQTVSALPGAAASLAGGWQSLAQIADALTQIDPDAAARFLRMALPASAYGTMPSAGNLYPTAQNIGSGMFFFLNALAGGDMRNWIGGRAADLLEEHGHGELLERAESEFGVMRSLYNDAPPQQWQALFLPVMAEGQVKTLRFYLKRERKGSAPGKPRQGDTRFIVEMEMSQTGQLQLDGLVRKRETATQFDLIIRSRKAFSGQAQRDIQDIYTSIGKATGYTGAVLFQQVSDFTIRPLEEILADQHREVTV